MFAIKHSNGTYFRFMSGIGPCFGGNEEEAKKFESREDAGMERGHWAFTGTEIVELEQGATTQGTPEGM